MKKIIRLFAFFLLTVSLSNLIAAQKIDRIEPPSWFTGMKETAVQLMVYGKEMGSFDAAVSYPGVKITTLVKTDNPNYLLSILISATKRFRGTFN